MLEERREWSDKESKERVLLEKMLAAGFDEQVHRRAVSESEEQQRAQLIRKRRNADPLAARQRQKVVPLREAMWRQINASQDAARRVLARQENREWTDFIDLLKKSLSHITAHRVAPLPSSTRVVSPSLVDRGVLYQPLETVPPRANKMNSNNKTIETKASPLPPVQRRPQVSVLPPPKGGKLQQDRSPTKPVTEKEITHSDGGVRQRELGEHDVHRRAQSVSPARLLDQERMHATTPIQHGKQQLFSATEPRPVRTLSRLPAIVVSPQIKRQIIWGEDQPIRPPDPTDRNRSERRVEW